MVVTMNIKFTNVKGLFSMLLFIKWKEQNRVSFKSTDFQSNELGFGVKALFLYTCVTLRELLFLTLTLSSVKAG